MSRTLSPSTMISPLRGTAEEFLPIFSIRKIFLSFIYKTLKTQNLQKSFLSHSNTPALNNSHSAIQTHNKKHRVPSFPPLNQKRPLFFATYTTTKRITNSNNNCNKGSNLKKQQQPTKGTKEDRANLFQPSNIFLTMFSPSQLCFPFLAQNMT